MDVVAIDFETANGQASSACQLAAVVVRDSQIVTEHSWLIRPPGMYFSPRNIAVHGIRPKDVLDAPDMEQVWVELSAIVDGQVLLAHNARFDIGVLIASLAAFDVACPNFDFTCTRFLARCAWPGRSGYGLKPLGNWLGIQFRHHDALEDARCCAHIAMTIEKQQQADNLPSLEQKLRITRGKIRSASIASPRSIGKRGSTPASPRASTDRWGFPDRRIKVGGIDASAVLTAAAEQKPLAEKNIVLLGPLRGLDFQQSQQLIAELGGVCQASIEPSTHYVVACGRTLDEASQIVCQSMADSPSNRSPFPEAGKQESERHDTKLTGIRLLSERQFRALLPAGKANTRW